MNILFFTYDFPYPTNSGGKTRAYNLLKFAKKDAEITLFSFIRENFEKKNKEFLEKLGIKNIHLFPRRPVVDFRNLSSFFTKRSLFHSLYFEKAVERKLLEIVKEERIDIVHFESFYTGYYLSDQLKKLGVKQVLGTENIEYLLYEGYAKYHESVAMRLFFRRQAKLLKQEEEGFYQLADAVLAVTNAEKEYIAKKCKQSVVVIENGVETKKFKKSKINPSRALLFIGNFSYFPNVDAMRWFMKNVFPKISDDIKLVVVGRKSNKMQFLKRKRVETKEFVEDISDAYSLGTVFIAPVRIGGGTNFKILEAMASRVPVVALSERISSFDFIDGRELLIAKDAGEFAEKIHLLLADEKLRTKLSENAFAAVKKDYDWTSIGTKLYNTWKSLLDEKY